MLSLASLSCSVLEDRGECLCHVEIFPGDVYRGEMAVYFWRSSRQVFSEKMLLAPGPGNAVLKTDMAKGLTGMCAVWSPAAGFAPGTDNIYIPLGHQADSLYVYERIVDCRGDFATDTVSLHKNFASLHLHFDDDGSGLYPYFAIVTSDVCGVRLPDLSPLEGPFEYFLHIDGSMSSDCTLPRQKDTSLQIALYKNGDGSLAYIFPLAQAMEEAGYDWTKRDLDDVEVWVDYVRGNMIVDVVPWDTEVMDEICI